MFTLGPALLDILHDDDDDDDDEQGFKNLSSTCLSKLLRAGGLKFRIVLCIVDGLFFRFVIINSC